MRALLAFAGLTLASFTIPWPSQLYPSGGAYERAAQVHTALVERAYAIGIEPPSVPDRWSADRANLIAVKQALKLLLITNFWVHPDSDLSVTNLMTNGLGYLSRQVALARAIPGGLPTNWYDVTPWAGLSAATNGWRFVPNIVSQMYLTVASGTYASNVVKREASITVGPQWCTNRDSIIWVADKVMRSQWETLRDASYSWPIVDQGPVVSAAGSPPQAGIRITSSADWDSGCDEDDSEKVSATVVSSASMSLVGPVYAAASFTTNMQARPAALFGYHMTASVGTNCSTVTEWVPTTNIVALGAEALEESVVSGALVLFHPTPYLGYVNDPIYLADYDEACQGADSLSFYKFTGWETINVPNGRMILDWNHGAVPFRYP